MGVGEANWSQGGTVVLWGAPLFSHPNCQGQGGVRLSWQAAGVPGPVSPPSLPLRPPIAGLRTTWAEREPPESPEDPEDTFPGPDRGPWLARVWRSAATGTAASKVRVHGEQRIGTQMEA